MRETRPRKHVSRPAKYADLEDICGTKNAMRGRRRSRSTKSSGFEAQQRASRSHKAILRPGKIIRDDSKQAPSSNTEDVDVRRLRNGKEYRMDVAHDGRGQEPEKSQPSSETLTIRLRPLTSPRPHIIELRNNDTHAVTKSTRTTPRSDPDSLTLGHLQKQLSRERFEHERTKSLLLQKSKELVSARHFLDQTDALSFGEVVSIETLLNEAIIQISFMIADSVVLSVDQLPKTVQDTQRFSDARDTLKRLISPSLVCKLDEIWPGNNPAPEHDVIWIQYALQFYLVTFCANFLSNDGWFRDEDDTSVLAEVYEYICLSNNGPHSIAGRWRSLMHKAYRAQEPHRYRPLPLVDHTLNNIVDILLGIGAWDSKWDTKDFLKNFRNPMTHVVEVLFRLDLATKEQFITADILPLSPSPGSNFDPFTMEDKTGTASTDDIVVATVTLGLQVKPCSGGRSHHDIDVILQPIVILDSILNV